jgi:hypothetical protein
VSLSHRPATKHAFASRAITRHAGLADGSKALSPLEGFRDARTRWIVTHDFPQWKDEIAWMSLYFTTAVWASLALCLVYSISQRAPAMMQ